jgi:hypothetical protein
MSYYYQALLSTDPDFIQRVAACAAVEITLADLQPTQWAYDHMWIIAASPGFADAYSSAIVANVPTPGRDEAVISDGQILAAVQAIETTTP